MYYLRSIAILLICLQVGSCAYDAAANIEDWSTFLQKPNMENANALVEKVASQAAKCDWGSSANQLAFPPSIRQELFRQISSGNSASLRVGLYMERCLDGGDLGDFRRSTGLCFENNPNGFLKEMRDSSVSNSRFNSMMTMLPLTLVDDVSGQVVAIRHRVSLLRQNDAPAFVELRESGIVALKDQEALLIDMQNND